MNEDNPALHAARNSWRCVRGKLKDEWLALLADDVVVEDPIGRSPLDPQGEGHQGKAAVSEFWDANIAPNHIAIEVHESFTGGSEVAHLMTLTTTLPSGHAAKVRGIFTYAVNGAGLITSLRGFWELADMTVSASE